MQGSFRILRLLQEPAARLIYEMKHGRSSSKVFKDSYLLRMSWRKESVDHKTLLEAELWLEGIGFGRCRPSGRRLSTPEWSPPPVSTVPVPTKTSSSLFGQQGV